MEKPEKSPIVPPIKPSCATIVTFESMLEKNSLNDLNKGQIEINWREKII